MPPPKDETAEQREARLVKARKKAANSREEKMVEKYKNKVLEKVKQENEEHENEDEDNDDDDDNEAPEKLIKPVKEPKPVKEIKEPVKEIIPKAKAKKQSKVIIEQSSDDDDIFEDKPNVIFVKRVRPKPLPLEKVEPNPPSGGVPTQQQRPPPPQQQQVPIQQVPQQQQVPQRPPMTPQRRLELERYINMSQGRFLPISRPR